MRRTCCLYSTWVASQRCLWGYGWCPMLDCSLPFGCSWADWRLPNFKSQSVSWSCQVANTPDQCRQNVSFGHFPDIASLHQPCHSSISKPLKEQIVQARGVFECPLCWTMCKVVQSRVMGEAVYGGGSWYELSTRIHEVNTRFHNTANADLI